MLIETVMLPRPPAKRGGSKSPWCRASVPEEMKPMDTAERTRQGEQLLREIDLEG
jgi:hypothetical protein